MRASVDQSADYVMPGFRTPVLCRTFTTIRLLTVAACFVASSCSELSIKPDLDTLLVQDGDLPGELKGGAVSTDPAELVPAPERTLTRKFQKDGRPAGFVQVAIFSTVEQAKEAFEHGAKKLSSPTQMPYMEGAFTWFNGEHEGQVIFRKCRGVIHIDMRGMGQPADLKIYADKLMKRIESYVCEEKPKAA